MTNCHFHLKNFHFALKFKSGKSCDFGKDGQDLWVMLYQASNNISIAYWNVVHLFYTSTSAFWVYFSL